MLHWTIWDSCQAYTIIDDLIDRAVLPSWNSTTGRAIATGYTTTAEGMAIRKRVRRLQCQYLESGKTSQILLSSMLNRPSFAFELRYMAP